MSVKVMSWVWDHSRSRGRDRLVLLAISDCASDNGTHAWPSMAELRRKTGLSERTIQAALVTLVGIGELRVLRSAGPHGVNRYEVVMRTAADPEPPQDLHPAESAGVPPAGKKSQRKGRNPAESAAPQNSHPPQNSTVTPAGSAPGTVINRQDSSTKSPSKAHKRGTRLPDDFHITPEMRDWARDNVPDLAGAGETEKFIDYWRSVPGQRGVKLDWQATWRVWMRTAAERRQRAGPPKVNGGKPKLTDDPEIARRAAETIRRWTEQQQ